MPSWGRPPGAKGSKRRMQWEREQERWQEQARVEELDSDDTDTQGVGLNLGQQRFASDPLNFTGIDMAPRSRRAYEYDDEESSSSSGSESEYEGTDALQIALRDKEEALVQSALARIRRAQEKGKREVKLNQDELDALEKRRKRMEAAAAKAKGKNSSGSGKEKKRRNLVTVPIAAIDPGIQTKSRSRRETASSASNPPGLLIAGADGPTYAPIGYYPPQSSSTRDSPNRPRSASTQQQLIGQQPPPLYPSVLSNRHFSDGMRPTSSSSTSSRRPLPDEEGWMPGNSRRSSVSSQNFPIDPFEYQTSAHPPRIHEHFLQQQQQGRRNISGPAEVSYSAVRRSPPVGSGYPAGSRGPASDPSLRHRSSYRDELANSSTEDESDDLGNGVQVYVEEPEPEPAKEQRTVSRKPVGGSTGRKKGRR